MQKQRFLSQISKYATDQRFVRIFYVRRKPANFSHPAHSIIYDLDIPQKIPWNNSLIIKVIPIMT